MPAVKHERSANLAGVPVEDIFNRSIARFHDRVPDWDAFGDSHAEGTKRAQFRFIGVGGSTKPDPKALPAGNFTLSIMYLPVGQGGSAHTHEVEECFFVLKGVLTVFFDDEDGKRYEAQLGPWDCISCPAGILHGFVNNGVEPVYMQTMVGKGRPGPVGYADDALYQSEIARRSSAA